MWDQAAAAITDARSLYITAGAGMGVDSGLPDFRGPEGFWRAYPAARELGLDFADLANPRWFREDPRLAWGFYGHRAQLYRDTVPHHGFAVLRRWADSRTCTVFTSNVDGQFQQAGFPDASIYEVHGSIHHLQCSTSCTPTIWQNAHPFVVDPASLRAEGPLPRCPHCGGVARPNILMFGDWGFLEHRAESQGSAYTHRVLDAPAPAVVIECGAGTAVPTVRLHSEALQRRGALLIRINPREPEGPPGTLSLAAGAAEALTRLDTLMHPEA